MFCDDEPKKLPWDYFLTEYERDLLTLTLQQIVLRNPDKILDEITDEMDIMRANHGAFQNKALIK